jgi:hypothetical protein
LGCVCVDGEGVDISSTAGLYSFVTSRTIARGFFLAFLQFFLFLLFEILFL